MENSVYLRLSLALLLLMASNKKKRKKSMLFYDIFPVASYVLAKSAVKVVTVDLCFKSADQHQQPQATVVREPVCDI